MRGSYRVRRISSDEGDAFRAIRLRALTEDPEAFGATLATEAAFEPEAWAATAVAASVGGNRAIFFAESNKSAEGMVGVYIADGSADATLWGMWVAPGLRGSGAAESLLSAVEAWTTASGFDQVQLCYYGHNTAAAKFYARRGYLATEHVGSGAAMECEREINVAKALVAGNRGAPDTGPPDR